MMIFFAALYLAIIWFFARETFRDAPSVILMSLLVALASVSDIVGAIRSLKP